MLTGALSSLRETFSSTATIAEWLARRPGPAGLALIAPDNLDMLEITAGPSQMHQLRQRIGKMVESVFGRDNVVGSVFMEGLLVAFGPDSRDLCKARMSQVLREIAGVRLDLGTHSCAVTARAGIIWTEAPHSIDPEVVRRRLVTALVIARRDQRSCVAATHESADLIDTELTARLLCDIPAAIAENRLALNAQDIMARDPKPDSPQEIEILLQMRDREGNEYAPSSFLPAAECSALIEMIDRWVLHRVLVGFGPELRANPRLWVSINVSAASVGNPDFPEFLSGALRESRIDPYRVQLEITETTAIRDLDQAGKNIYAARRLGCRIALDDFGAGLSSYGYLKAFKPDCIKIDGALIPNVVDPDNVEAQIVGSIIKLANRLGIEVVAEHVSSPEILVALSGLGIDKVQGFELGRPRPLEQIFKGVQFRTLE